MQLLSYSYHKYVVANDEYAKDALRVADTRAPKIFLFTFYIALLFICLFSPFQLNLIFTASFLHHFPRSSV